MNNIKPQYFLKMAHRNWLRYLLASFCLLASFYEVKAQAGNNNCYITPGASFINFPANDDGSVPFTLPFNFNLYGTIYTSGWINNNGNITFTSSYGSFTANGFPFGIPMVAPFWADADTRGIGSGTVHFKINPTHMVVSWDHVGYYSKGVDKLNTYSAVISNGTDSVIGIGNNVAFYYGDMQWTTGVASGGIAGIGGTPATVGINKGDNVNYLQVGRFGTAGNTYDGPGGNIDGINYVANKCFTFNTSGITNQVPSVSGVPAANTINIACGETKTLNLSFITSVGQSLTTTVNTGGLCATILPAIINGNPSTASVAITGDLCSQGTHVISFTATDNNVIPLSTTVNITVNVASCCAVNAIAKNATIFLDATGNALLTNAAVNNLSTATCGIANITVAPNNFTCANKGANTVLLTIKDNNGNTSSATAIVTVVDSLPPVVKTQPVLVTLDVSGNGIITAENINNNSTDNCGILSLSINKKTFNYTNVGKNLVTLTLTDSSGNTASNTAIVTILAKGLNENGKIVTDTNAQTDQYGAKATGVGKTQYGQVFGSATATIPQ